MSKRTVTDSHKLKPKDFWPTPVFETWKLSPHLVPGTLFDEPCAGNGAIIVALTLLGHRCAGAVDITPRAAGIEQGDARTYVPVSGRIITNPPYRRDLLEPLLEHWIGQWDTWLLLPLDHLVNKWTNRFMRHVDQIVPLGRVSWLGNGRGGMENFCWFHFNTERRGLISARP